MIDDLYAPLSMAQEKRYESYTSLLGDSTKWPSCTSEPKSWHIRLRQDLITVASPTPKGKKWFASLLLDAVHIIMTSSQSHRDLKPGMLRICYCFVSLDVLEIAVNCLEDCWKDTKMALG